MKKKLIRKIIGCAVLTSLIVGGMVFMMHGIGMEIFLEILLTYGIALVIGLLFILGMYLIVKR